jgi:D-apionolactonase
VTESANLAQRGQVAAEPPVVELVAGALCVELAGTDVQAIRFRGSEVVQRIYMAVRDVPWNTIPGTVLEREIVQGDGRFRATFRQLHVHDDIDVEWSGAIEGTAAGELSYEMRALAKRDFRYSKIGLNIHHGLAEYRGRSFRARTDAGEVVGRLSEDIEPQLVQNGSLTAMFDHFDAISFDLDAATADFAFEGDRFEMQDHRNWSDANYKTYGTPLSFGFPRDIKAGDRLWQRMTLRLVGKDREQERHDFVQLRLVDDGAALPRIGHNIPGDAAASEPAMDVLSAARPDFVRVNIGPGDDIRDELARVRALVEAATCRIELAVSIDPALLDAAVAQLANALAERHDDIARVVVLAASPGFSEFKTATPPGLPRAVLTALRDRGIIVPVFSGTDQFFNELNRARPDYSGLDGIVFSLNPQVHACVDRALMQNAAAVIDIAAFCRRLYPRAELSIGPVHLLGPVGPFPGGPQTPGGPPQALDVRHTALFGAAWAVAFLQAAVQAKLENVTLFDLVGPRGLAERSDPEQQPEAFPSLPGKGFPLLWVLKKLRAEHLAGGEAIHGEGGGDRCALVGIHRGNASRLLLANLRQEVADVRLRVGASAAQVSILDETNVSTTEPVAGSEPSDGSQPTEEGVLALLLRPYAVACVDLTANSQALGGLA